MAKYVAVGRILKRVISYLVFEIMFTGHWPVLQTYNGHLVSCDNWMNITLRDVVCTSKVGVLF